MAGFVAKHPMRNQANGKPVAIVPLIIYSDDLSGNKTKKCDCFNAWSILLAGLPKALNRKLENIHLLTAFNRVSPLHMLDPIIVEELRSLHKMEWRCLMPYYTVKVWYMHQL